MNKHRPVILAAIGSVGLAVGWLLTSSPAVQSSPAATPPLEYIEQYVPITPFLPPPAPSRNYLQRSQPLPPWKPVTEPPPIFEEPAPAEPKTPPPPPDTEPTEGESKPAETFKTPTLPPVRIPSISIESDDRHLAPPPPEITVSPWFTISSAPPTAPGAGDAATGVSSNAVPSFIRRSIQGGNMDFYIPFSITPGGYNPPPASSVIIYTQPD
jgi:hypothetical protein